MKSFWQIFLYAMPIGLGVVLSLISIAYTTEVMHYNPADKIIAAIFFGILGYPMLIASTIRFTKMFSEN